MTWLGFVNYYFLRWFFLRLYKTVEETGEITECGLMVGVWPISGYGCKYEWIRNKKRYLTLWKKTNKQ